MTDIDLTGQRLPRRRRRIVVRANHADLCPRRGFVWAAAATGVDLLDVGRCTSCGAVARARPRNVTSGLNASPASDHIPEFQRASLPA